MNINEQARFVGDQYKKLKQELIKHKEYAESMSVDFKYDGYKVELTLTPLEN